DAIGAARDVSVTGNVYSNAGSPCVASSDYYRIVAAAEVGGVRQPQHGTRETQLTYKGILGALQGIVGSRQSIHSREIAGDGYTRNISVTRGVKSDALPDHSIV